MDNSKKSDAVADALGAALEQKASKMAHEAYCRVMGPGKFAWEDMDPAEKQAWSQVAATMVNVTMNAVLAGKVALSGG